MTQYRLFSNIDYAWLPEKPSVVNGRSVPVTADTMATTLRVDTVVLLKDFELTGRPPLISRSKCTGKEAEHTKLKLLFDTFAPTLAAASRTALAQQLNRMSSEEVYGSLVSPTQIPPLSANQTQVLLQRASNDAAGYMMFICPAVSKQLPPLSEVRPKPFDPRCLMSAPDSADFPVSITNEEEAITQCLNEKKRALEGAKQIARVAQRMVSPKSYTRITDTTSAHFSFDSERLTPEEVKFYEARLTEEMVIQLTGEKYRQAASEPWSYCPTPPLSKAAAEHAAACFAATEARRVALVAECGMKLSRGAYNIDPASEIVSRDGHDCSNVSSKRVLSGTTNSTSTTKKNKTASAHQTLLDGAFANVQVVVCGVLACAQNGHHLCSRKGCAEGVRYCIPHKDHKEHCKLPKKSIVPPPASSNSQVRELFSAPHAVASANESALPEVPGRTTAEPSHEELATKLNGRYGFKPREYLHEAADPNDIKEIREMLSTTADENAIFCLNMWLAALETTKTIIDRDDHAAKNQNEKNLASSSTQSNPRKRVAPSSHPDAATTQRSRTASTHRLQFKSLAKFGNGTLAERLLENLTNESEKPCPDYIRRIVDTLNYASYKSGLSQLITDYEIAWSINVKFRGDAQEPHLVDFGNQFNRRTFLDRFAELLVKKYSGK